MAATMLGSVADGASGGNHGVSAWRRVQLVRLRHKSTRKMTKVSLDLPLFYRSSSSLSSLSVSWPTVGVFAFKLEGVRAMSISRVCRRGVRVSESERESCLGVTAGVLKMRNCFNHFLSSPYGRGEWSDFGLSS